jgi:hypothetical protein
MDIKANDFTKRNWRFPFVGIGAAVVIAAAVIAGPQIGQALGAHSTAAVSAPATDAQQVQTIIAGETAAPVPVDQAAIDAAAKIVADQAAADALAAQQAAQVAAAKAAAAKAATVAAKAPAKAATQKTATNSANGAPAGTRVPFTPSSDPQNANGGDYADPGTFCAAHSASTVGGVPVCD